MSDEPKDANTPPIPQPRNRNVLPNPGPGPSSVRPRTTVRRVQSLHSRPDTFKPIVGTVRSRIQRFENVPRHENEDVSSSKPGSSNEEEDAVGPLRTNSRRDLENQKPDFMRENKPVRKPNFLRNTVAFYENHPIHAKLDELIGVKEGHPRGTTPSTGRAALVPGSGNHTVDDQPTIGDESRKTKKITPFRRKYNFMDRGESKRFSKRNVA